VRRRGEVLQLQETLPRQWVATNQLNWLRHVFGCDLLCCEVGFHVGRKHGHNLKLCGAYLCNRRAQGDPRSNNCQRKSSRSSGVPARECHELKSLPKRRCQGKGQVAMPNGHVNNKYLIKKLCHAMLYTIHIFM